MSGGELTCAVTGASGYVGSGIVRSLEAAGWNVVRLGRKAGDVPFALGDEVRPESAFAGGPSVLIHCAYDFRARGWEEIRYVNVEGSRRLFAAARAAGVTRLICISSTAAFEGCRSDYGKAKLAIEACAREAFGAGAVIVRPGLVCGAQPGGIVGTLAKLVKKSPVVPIVGPSTIIHTVQDDELAAFIERLASGALDNRVAPDGASIVAATEVGISFRDLLDRVALSDGRKVVWAPVPWPLVWSLVRGVELLGIPIGLRSDSLVSFIHLNRNIDFTQTRRTGTTFRPFVS